MTSPISGSEHPQPSTSFHRLHPRLQRWVHDQGWTTLHDAQERAIAPILDADHDVIIAAATAAGKTEAAFLPICSALVDTDHAAPAAQRDPWTVHDPWTEGPSTPSTGVQVLYLSPLKALINDQYDRLEQLCERAEIPVHRWHGDVANSAKQRTLRAPSGILLITPESLEATFVNRGTRVTALFAGLRYVVIDELHSFLATLRGAQLQSLLNRVELAIRRRPPRIGLSATLGDMNAAARFLRPTAPDRVLIISSHTDSRDLKLQVRGYLAAPPTMTAKAAANAEHAGHEVAVEDTTDGDKLAIVEHLFTHLRGADNLVFANARREVEVYADLLARRCEAERLPNEFWPHHGSLAKDMRESVEAALKDRTRPATAICTSTLEMGIDIGSVASVAQIGPPPAVASLRQRLGRSGRRDEPAVLRAYITEPELDTRSSILDELRVQLVQTVAMVRLLLNRWLEPPSDPGLNLSTLIQQVLSTIAQHGGATAIELHGALCGPGPFQLVDPSRFARLLRAMAAADLIIQTTDGALLHGKVGERAVNHYSFYTAFQTAEEWRLVTGGKTLGTVPITQPLYEGVLLIFAGKRWRVLSIDDRSHVVELVRAAGGNPPTFGGDPAMIGGRVRTEMTLVYEDSVAPTWLDAAGRQLLAQGQAAWRRLGLAHTAVVAAGNDVTILPWTSDQALFTTVIALRAAGLDAAIEGPSIAINGVGISELESAVETLTNSQPPDPVHLAAGIENKLLDKWDWALDDSLICEADAARRLDVPGAWAVLDKVLHDVRRTPSDDPPAGDRAPSANDTASHPLLTSSRRTAAESLREQEFCVVDVETTGFSPRLGDRILEVAAVRMRGDGTVLAEWTTLVDPQRDVGAIHVHGITAADVVDAPRFDEVIGDLLDHVDGAVLVAHNLRFDHEFLAAEFTRAGHTIPAIPAMCTLALGALVQPGAASRKLAACCDRLSIPIPLAHSARDDARAAGKLLTAYLAMATQAGRRTLEQIGCTPLHWPHLMLQLPAVGRQQLRGAGSARIGDQGQYLARLVKQLDDFAVDDPNTAAYLELLDRALEDRRLTTRESEALLATAADWGLSTREVDSTHRAYFASLLASAASDTVISDLEQNDLHLVATLIGIERHVADELIVAAVQRTLTIGGATKVSGGALTGLSVCFTGALAGRIDDTPITRSMAQDLARRAGLVVRENVVKGLDLLVVAEPDTQSGKARRARELGTRVIAESVFWSSIGVTTD
jgi:ATP-dependent Lhr-like helicase